MSLTTTTHDSLPYIDPEPTPAQRSQAQDLINAELSSTSTTTTTTTSTTHPLLPAPPPSNPTPLMAQEYQRLEAHRSLQAIDLTRYESLATTSSDSDSSTSTSTLLAQSHTASTYLTQRHQTLDALAAAGKPQWLAHNAALTALLARLEHDLAERRTHLDRVAAARRAAQQGVAAELLVLAETWRRGVGRVVEAEIAAEALRGEILERRRSGAREERD